MISRILLLLLKSTAKPFVGDRSKPGEITRMALALYTGLRSFTLCLLYIFGHYRVSRGWGKWRTINAVEKEETNKSWEIGLIKNAAHIVVW